MRLLGDARCEGNGLLRPAELVGACLSGAVRTADALPGASLSRTAQIATLLPTLLVRIDSSHALF